MSKVNVAIVNYGMGNLNSVQKAFSRIGSNAVITSDEEEIRSADKLVLPGVGHFKMGMEKLIGSGLKDLLDELVLQQKKPILGICLGMQLFTSFSEEGNVEGLNWIPGKTRFFGEELFVAGRRLPVPHMGWNGLETGREHRLFTGIGQQDTFYFVHSYAVSAENQSDVVAKTTYGNSFDAVIGRDNIIGTQFHPEKSHAAGLQLLTNFINLY